MKRDCFAVRPCIPLVALYMCQPVDAFCICIDGWESTLSEAPVYGAMQTGLTTPPKLLT